MRFRSLPAAWSFLCAAALLAGCAGSDGSVHGADYYLPVPTGEHLVVPIPAGWHAAQAVPLRQMYFVEYVPLGETRAKWTDMLTAVWIDRAIYPTLASESASRRAVFAKKCAVPPVLDTPREFDDGDWHAMIETMRCGKSPEGAGYIAVFKTIKGPAGYYQVQRAWRKFAAADSRDITVSDADMTAALDELNGFHLTQAEKK